VYEERASPITGATVWRRTGDRPETRVLPDGCMDLIWTGDTLLVAGPDTVAHLSRSAPGTAFVGLRFAPGTGPTVLGVPAHALRDQRVFLDDVWPAAEVARVTGMLDSGMDPIAVLEQVAAVRFRRSGPVDPALRHLSRRLGDGAAVTTVAAEVGYSPRQLHRRCLLAFGYGPKTLARILRMGRALTLARTGAPLAGVAAVAGYADQAHLWRDVRALAGVPLGQLLT
jgi:AraC-like DNA-binding protein